MELELNNLQLEFNNKLSLMKKEFELKIKEIELKHTIHNKEQATYENTSLGDYVVQIYTNKNGNVFGPFYSKITGFNKNSWKIVSVDAFGNEIPNCNIITQIKNDGTENIVKRTSVHFGDRKNKNNYISWKYIPLEM